MNNNILLEQTHKATGSRIFLTPMSDRHIQHLILLARDPSLIDLMGWNTFFEIKDTEEFIKNISAFVLPYSQLSQPVILGIYLDLESFPIGYVVLKGVNMSLLTAEIGVAILDRKHRKGGYGRLALKRMVKYAFSELHLQTIGATILLSNKSSINIGKKLGFIIREIMTDSWSMPNGDITDMVLMEVTQETWIDR
ncbi:MULTISPECIES: GNAT family N-acetyltransferase [Spirulina sp. CCY15215]|uniref:GNAT family N-acetyltransferase n=1 Tax=Spirulina sp. CCY15215 TaxID=2767591 RepID=UPI0019527C48|nr:GNAT family N-acetyltransferase [Spirulina major]